MCFLLEVMRNSNSHEWAICKIAVSLMVQVHFGSRRLSTSSFGFTGLCICCAIVSAPPLLMLWMLHTCARCSKYSFLLVATYRLQRITKQLGFCLTRGTSKNAITVKSSECRSMNVVPALRVHLFATLRTATETSTLFL